MLSSKMKIVAVLAAVYGAAAFGASAQENSKPATNTAAMAKLAGMKGVWKGEASGYGPGGVPFKVTQTERIGPMLGGDILVIEGRGYAADGKVAFNAFGVISYDVRSQAYEFRAYNAGNGGTFPMTLTDTGAVWEISAGPKAKVVSTITLTPTTWTEVQQYVMDGQPPRTIVQMSLTRASDTDWPAANPVKP